MSELNKEITPVKSIGSHINTANNNEDSDDQSSNNNNNGKVDALLLPRATINKMIDELLPPGIACPKETRELLLHCCTEFIHLVTGEANDLCETAGRKTISPEHVLDALKSLGFGDYCAEAEAAKIEFEEGMKQKKDSRERSKTTLERSGLSESELIKQQEDLFEAARQRYLSQIGTVSTSPIRECASADKEDDSKKKENTDKKVEKMIVSDNEDDDEDEVKSGTKPL